MRPQRFTHASPMLPDAEFEADVVLVAPREFEVTRAQRTYREKNFTTFTELLNLGAFHADHIQRISEALGLEALAAYLREAGLRVAVLNCNVAPHTPAEVARKVARSRARVIGISLIYRPQVGYALELMEALRPLKDLKVVAGGALASYLPRELLSRLARLDAVVFGEAEETFRDYCLAVLGGLDSTALPGVAFRDGVLPVLNPAAAPLDLAVIRPPARDSLEYLRAMGWPTRIASIYTSRGCLAKCTFCTGKDAYNVERKITYRYRDPVQVVDEIQYLHEAFGVKFVYINDDNFLGYGKKSFDRVRLFAEELIRRDLGVQFATECRVDGVNLEVLRLLKEAGMRQVLMGVESGSDSVLKRWRKGATVEQNHRAVDICDEAGMTLEPGFILFDAETSRDELADNLGFIRKARFDRIPFPTYLINRLSVYPGTEVEREWTEKGILQPSPIPAQRTYCPSDRNWLKLWRDGVIAIEAANRGGGELVDDPAAVIAYFQRLEYSCADPRSEIAWRGLRYGIEPVERFIESQLPGTISILSECRGPDLSPGLRREVRDLVHRLARWRQGVGELVVAMLETTLASYDLDGGIPQLRWLRRSLGDLREAHDRATLGTSPDALAARVLEIRRTLVPLHAAVVIPTAGKWSRLRRTLASLARQQIPAGTRCEVVLVLDGIPAPDDLPSRVGELPLRALRLETTRGRGAARNAGIAAARAETVILLDDDIVVGPRFVVAHLEAQSQRPALCSGAVRELPGLVYFDDLDTLSIVSGFSDQRAAERMRAPARRLLAALDDVESCWDRYGKPSALETEGTEAYNKGHLYAAWVAFAGANLSAPRKWFLTSPFDERPGSRWGLEDLALALSWLRKGRALALAGQAFGLHLSHPRPNWQHDLRANAICLDFLGESAGEAVMQYLEGRAPLTEVEAAMAAAPLHPSATPN